MFQCTRDNRPDSVEDTKPVRLAVTNDAYGQPVICADWITFEDIAPIGILVPLPVRCTAMGNGVRGKAFQLLRSSLPIKLSAKVMISVMLPQIVCLRMESGNSRMLFTCYIAERSSQVTHSRCTKQPGWKVLPRLTSRNRWPCGMSRYNARRIFRARIIFVLPAAALRHRDGRFPGTNPAAFSEYHDV